MTQITPSPAPAELAHIQTVILDLAGTTVQDEGLVERAFALTAERTGIAQGEAAREQALQIVRDTMGQSKIEVFRMIADSEEDAQRGNLAFEDSYAELAGQVGLAEIPGAEAAIRSIRGAGRFVVLTTGFSPVTRDAILTALGWTELADAVLSPADAGRGRPFPDMPLTGLLRTGASSVTNLAVLGDTTSDIGAGLAAGAGFVAGVLTGAHGRDALLGAGAHRVLDSVAELPALLGIDATRVG
ncbi:HAD family hydrolase [Leucobacter sp. M11]|uniref:HAD family hydrolase n=1 Tax=Leucobacter sp. M11 TaxID=2993565 RepID=UPI002D7EFCB2|nr:HAD family hydrolase [Leucobacter sp. M11]MEB4614702.1 HAD hydrolase-like protein [Leucobacter sp. M11]